MAATPSFTLIAHRAVPAAALLAVLGCRDADAPLLTVEPAPPPDVTASVERLGNPFVSPSPYARNVWDMQRFGGRIYLGHGDSQDNWGPIPIWSLDPSTGRFAEEFTADEEQVDVFHVLGGALYTPGHDPRDDWTFGNFYRLDGAGWTKHRTIPHGLHAFDLALQGGTLFAALGAEGKPGQETILASADGGETWAPATDEVERVYTLFELQGELYGAPKLWNDADPAKGALLRFDGARFARTAIAGGTLLPGTAPGSSGRMVRPTEFGGALVYVVANNTFDWIPAALAVTRNLRDVRPVVLPDPAAVPYDFLVRDGVLHVLAAAPSAAGETIYVYRTDDLARWTELFHFSAPTFARSFEEDAGDFFFGLGSHYDTPSPATGDVLRVPRASYAPR